MNDIAADLRDALSGGANLEQALAHLHESGARPVPTIKALREILGVSLGEAKRIFDASPAWRAHAEAGRRLHEEILRVLGEDGGDAL